MYCRKCGNKLLEGAQFCGQCGAKVFDANNQSIQYDRDAYSKRNCAKEKNEYYKTGNGGKKYQTVKILSVLHIIFESVLFVLGTLGVINIFRFVIAIKNNSSGTANFSVVYIYPAELLIFFGLFLLLQIRGIKKNSTGRFIAALFFGIFHTCTCCLLAFNKPVINIPILIMTIAIQITLIIMMIFCNKKYKTSLHTKKELLL